MASGYWSPLAIATADGPTLTAAAAATCLPVTALYTFPPNAIGVGTMLHVRASGRMSCVITTPGTARFDLRLGGTVIFDTGALPMNVVAKTTVPFWLEVFVTCRSTGASPSFFGSGALLTEALLGGLPSASGDGSFYLSAVAAGADSAPVVVSAGNTTVANAFDMFFTQTVATGSVTVHQFSLSSGSVALA